MNTPMDAEAIKRAEQGAQMLERVLALQPLFRENAQRAREERRVPAENIQALLDAGFFLALQPAHWGGFELDPQDFFRMQMSIAEACMSTAWASGIVSVHAFQLALMDRRAQADVWDQDIHTGLLLLRPHGQGGAGGGWLQIQRSLGLEQRLRSL